MESRMVNFIADNSPSLDNSAALEIIRSFFEKHLRDFELVNWFDNGRYEGFRIEYRRNKFIVAFSSSWKGIEYDILVNDHPFYLSDFDAEYKNIITCSKKNLEYTLKVLKRFVEEQSR